MLRPSTVAAATTVGLAVVGAARRGRELRRVRGRRLAPLSPATHTLPPAMGRTASALSTWTPGRPGTATGRAVTAAWAAPLTVSGALLALAGGARARWDPRRGCWVATGVRGPSARVLRAIGMSANAMGHVVVCTTATPSEALLDHEAVHVRQAERLGPGLVLAYGWFTARYGYRDNPIERAARRGAARRGRRAG